MKLSAFRRDSAAVESGVWIGDLPGMGELRLKVRGLGNADWRRLSDKMTSAAPLTKRTAAGSIVPEEMERITTELVIETCLLDWEGIEDEQGQPLAYSKETARQILFDPDYRELLNAVLDAARMVGKQNAQITETDAKN